MCYLIFNIYCCFMFHGYSFQIQSTNKIKNHFIQSTNIPSFQTMRRFYFQRWFPSASGSSPCAAAAPTTAWYFSFRLITYFSHSLFQIFNFKFAFVAGVLSIVFDANSDLDGHQADEDGRRRGRNGGRRQRPGRRLRRRRLG